MYADSSGGTLIADSWKTASIGEEIMAYGASNSVHRYNSPFESKEFCNASSMQEWIPDTLLNSASAQGEIEIQRRMDRLLRECLTRRAAQ
jgi:hypothetical protein